MNSNEGNVIKCRRHELLKIDRAKLDICSDYNTCRIDMDVVSFLGYQLVGLYFGTNEPDHLFEFLNEFASIKEFVVTMMCPNKRGAFRNYRETFAECKQIPKRSVLARRAKKRY
jgi:hypothetical protein